MGDWTTRQGKQQQQARWRQREEQGRTPWPTRDPARYGRPPPAPASSGQSVPRWERDFCTSECSIPWKRLCETKKVMHMYESITRWNDLAAEEAFLNAKARYWARIQGQQCNIPLPEPDMYIDVVDQDTVIDPELVEDLYKQPSITDDGDRDAGCHWDSFLFADKPVPATGWGDAEDPPKDANSGNALDQAGCGIVATGWGDTEEPQGTTWDTNWNANDSKDVKWNQSVGWYGTGDPCSNSMRQWDGGDDSWDQWQSRGTTNQAYTYHVQDHQRRDNRQHRRRRRTDHDYGQPWHQYKEQCNAFV